MYIAGADTVRYCTRIPIRSLNISPFQTTSSLYTFFLAMTLNPDVQDKAQRSIDHVCHGRLPYFSDYDSLPYVHAIVKECLRWKPVAQLSESSTIHNLVYVRLQLHPSFRLRTYVYTR